MGLIHIDAHTDTWDAFMGSRYSHGAPFRRAVEEGLIDPHRTIRIGIRGTQNSTEGWDYSNATGMRVVFMDEVTRVGVEACHRRLFGPRAGNRPICRSTSPVSTRPSHQEQERPTWAV